jgi:hypothetical protein
MSTQLKLQVVLELGGLGLTTLKNKQKKIGNR